MDILLILFAEYVLLFAVLIHELAIRYLKMCDVINAYRSMFAKTMSNKWSMTYTNMLSLLSKPYELDRIVKDNNVELTNKDMEFIATQSLFRNNFKMFKHLFECYEFKPTIEGKSWGKYVDPYGSIFIHNIVSTHLNIDTYPFIKYLVEVYGMDPRVKEYSKENILYKAIKYDNVHIVKYLVEEQGMVYKQLPDMPPLKPGSNSHAFLRSKGMM